MPNMSHARLILCTILVAIIFALSLGFAAEQDKPNQKDILTPEERQWLSEHYGLIRIGITEIPPQVLRGETEGDYKGLSIDYIKLIERKLRCKFRLVYYTTWNEVMQAARNNDIDMIFAAQKTPERSEYLLFSTPYIELPNMIIVRKNMEDAFTLEKMKGLKIACSEGSAVHEFLKANYGYLDLYPVKDEMTGLVKVSFGEADAMVVEISRASYSIEKAKITNLRVAGSAGYKYELCFASRKDWPVLTRILDKGLSLVTDADREAITRKWIVVSSESILASRKFWVPFAAGLSVITLILLWVISWNQALKAQVTERTRQLHQELMERKRAEEELRKAYMGLEQRVEERTTDLYTEMYVRRQAEEALQKANAELESFSYSVSHDLRAPLRGIDGWSLAILEDCADQLDKQGRKYLEFVRMETQRMGRLIDGLLQLSRVTRAEMMHEQVDLSSLVCSIASRLHDAEPERLVEFTIQPGLVTYGDPRLIEVVLVNLLNNSWKFTGKHPSARIEFGRTEMEGRTVYFIRDDGAGFDMAHAGKLFGAFQRMHQTSEFPGSGIGLATVQRIVHRHGGRVWVEAEVEKGATFYFIL